MHAITIDKPGLLNDITSFFVSQALSIETININTVNNNNGIAMCNLDLIIKIPENYHIPTLREKFINHCDNINLDAGLEPFRD
jgi:glycine cleavage system transcriptional repressor